MSVTLIAYHVLTHDTSIIYDIIMICGHMISGGTKVPDEIHEKGVRMTGI